MNRISTCWGCQAREQGIKSRIAIPHTCGLEPKSIRTQLFYAIEDEDLPESVEPQVNHKWSKWEKQEVSTQLKMLGITGEYLRKCLVCGANQYKTYYRNQSWPELKIERNGREDVDCNPELSQSNTKE